MMKRWRVSKLWLAASVLVAAISSGSVAAESASLCKEFSRFTLQSTPRPNAVERLQLDAVPDPKQALEHYLNLDIDGDDVSEAIEQSCGSILMPSDPCTLSVKLSSSGKTLTFEAWGFLLFRYRGQIYISANSDVTKKKTNIHKIETSGFKLVCENL
jgi:hypothetical protein